MDDMSDVVNELSDNDEFTIYRRGIGLTTAGRYTPATPTQSNAVGVVTPASARDLLRLPEGRRTEKVKRIITSTELVTEPVADVIEYEGLFWEVQRVDPYVFFFDCLAIKKVTQTP